MARRSIPRGGIRHGTATSYKDYGCRCPECRQANTEYVRRRRDELQAKGLADPSLIPHGTVTAYQNWRCRCEQCKPLGNKKLRAEVAAKKLKFDPATYFDNTDDFLASLDG